MQAGPNVSGIEILGELGRGAHSVVYRGQQGFTPCAVKLPRAKARWTRWIYREAVALARVRHPSLPAVLEVGETDGLPYLVMELVRGESLADVLAGGPITEETTISIGRQLASVLAAVHDAGLVHRDVKPRNIIVEPSSGALTLVDFGFATPMERAGTVDPAGTAAYAAPEQLAPPVSVDARTDLYAVGCVLFECLTGRRYVDLQASAGRRPDVRAELLAHGASPALANVIGVLVRERPEERYRDAHALGAELERIARAERPLGPARDDAAPRPALVIHESELREITTLCRERRGAVVVVRGARGGGKTRVLAAVSEVSDVATVIAATCQRYDPPLATLRRVLASYCGWLFDDRRAGVADELRALVGPLAQFAQIVSPELAALVGVHPREQPPHDLAAADAFAEGAAELVVRLTTKLGPVVLTIDDAHWMDAASAEVLSRLAHRAAEARITLVLGARPAPTDGPVARFARVRRSVEVVLPPLGREQVHALVSAYLGTPADPVLVGRIEALAGGGPLGVVEVLGAFVDAGALRPQARRWLFEPEKAHRAALPNGTLTLLGRRVGELPVATRRVVELAAVMGQSFPDELLAVVSELTMEEVGYATAQSRRAGLIEIEAPGRHRFVHETLREMLVDELPPEERRAHSQRIAEALDARGALSFEELCVAARHFADGDRQKDPASWYRVARAAGEAALARFDNERAIELHEQAREAAELAGIPLDSAFFLSIGEANVRLGSYDESLQAFEAALERAPDATRRASVLGRLAWVHQSRSDPSSAWEKLGLAFESVGQRMPVEDVVSAAATSARLARSRVGRLLGRARPLPPVDVDLLCSLHYQNARLGLEYGKPARLAQSALESIELSERGASASARARSRAFYALGVTALGMRDLGARRMAEAKQLAASDGDAATIAFCCVLDGATTTWAGDLDRALELFRECVDTYGPWLELNEYCLVLCSAEAIEALRGRADQSWQWMHRALERLRRSGTRPALVDFVVQRGRAALAAIGREPGDDVWLANLLASVAPGDPGRGYHRVTAWGPCARYYLETGVLGEELDALVRAFESEGHDPRSAHIGLSEYYVCVAYARVQACIAAKSHERPQHLRTLRKAAIDLRATARVPLLKAHWLVVDAFLAWLEGDGKRAVRELVEAEALGNEETSPWILHGVASARAHMLRAEGKDQAARDQARVAELLARRHGAVMRAAATREEFGLTSARTHSSSPPRPRRASNRSSSSSSGATRQLAALLHVAQAPRRDLKAEQQAVRILDELLGAVQASAGAIWFQPEPNAAATSVLRQRDREASVIHGSDAPQIALLRAVHQAGEPWPSRRDEAVLPEAHGFDPARIIAVPLKLYEKPVGALCLERGQLEAPFAVEDRSLLDLLAHQVPITLEIARLLFEREQLHVSLQHAKKMEAMGQLAGGLAHDFNNMLAAMKVALFAARERATSDPELVAELDVIGQATTRAAQLTSQLLSFSRHQPVRPGVHDVNQLITSFEPMLQRVVGASSRVTLATELSPAVRAVEVDPGSFDQALVNLLMNARDAMPEGGTITISTRNVVLDEPVAERCSLVPGAYVQVEVADTGEGMTPETISRVFEPFFTTKPSGKGSGLGLAMVYAFARNCGGSVDVLSELGHGTRFRLYLRRAEARAVSRAPRALGAGAPVARAEGSSPSASLGSGEGDTILVVDDDDLVRRTIAKILERHGYRVVAASGSAQAIDAVKEHGSRIGLVILDVLMPGVTGPELGRRLYELNRSTKLLFVSGYSPESIPLVEAQVASDMLLQKPFSQNALLERVRQLLVQ